MASETKPSPALKQCPSLVNFTIGWICVLQKEYRAALAILDETYDNIALAPGKGDRNHYVFGRVGEHYVVVNPPPSGWQGRIRASTIAYDMRGSFPRMRFALIVGIAGGAPSAKEDVRLGDVVLGTQVVPWNTGKWTQDGFQRTGMARAPPRELLEAITFFDQRLWSPGELLRPYRVNMRLPAGRVGTARAALSAPQTRWRACQGIPRGYWVRRRGHEECTNARCGR